MAATREGGESSSSPSGALSGSLGVLNAGGGSWRGAADGELHPLGASTCGGLLCPPARGCPPGSRRGRSRRARARGPVERPKVGGGGEEAGGGGQHGGQHSPVGPGAAGRAVGRSPGSPCGQRVQHCPVGPGQLQCSWRGSCPNPGCAPVATALPQFPSPCQAFYGAWMKAQGWGCCNEASWAPTSAGAAPLPAPTGPRLPPGLTPCPRSRPPPGRPRPGSPAASASPSPSCGRAPGRCPTRVPSLGPSPRRHPG